MAIPSFINATGKELELPTPNGSTMILKNGEVVEGSYYQQYVAKKILQAYSGPVTPKYVFPEQLTLDLVTGPPVVGSDNWTAPLYQVRVDMSGANPVAYIVTSTNPTVWYKGTLSTLVV